MSLHAAFTRKLREHTASCFCSSSFPPSKGTLAFFAVASTEYTTTSRGFALAVATHVTFSTYALNAQSPLCGVSADWMRPSPLHRESPRPAPVAKPGYAQSLRSSCPS